MTIEDKLLHHERIRLEALAQAVQLEYRHGIRPDRRSMADEVAAAAATFEAFIVGEPQS